MRECDNPDETPRRRVFSALAIGTAAVLAVALGVTVLRVPPPLFLWNESASLATGLYAVRPGADVSRGDIVVARLPDIARALAAERGYVPVRVPIIKRVAALPGDRVCTREAAMLVNGRIVAWRLATDAAGRPMAWWSGCGVLREGVLLLGEDPRSFDGRYFGPIGAERVIGTARPM